MPGMARCLVNYRVGWCVKGPMDRRSRQVRRAMPVNPRLARIHDPATRVAEVVESELEDGNCLGRPGRSGHP